mmetsp:Transcript_20662/g.31274  ORF Transcript_20662/g.31274 Transcript_20662/m.31274 type:complete len:319 (+) Transcript_20662:39-995(+)
MQRRLIFVANIAFGRALSSVAMSIKNIKDGGGGIMMILSPAKTLDLSSCSDRLSTMWTEPECDIIKTNEIACEVKKRKQKDLQKLLGVSANLAETAYSYWSSFEQDAKKATETSDRKPSIFSFSGAAYQGLQASECSDDAILYMQRNLRIIDPLYGVLLPLDVMQPYRLEMATKELFHSDKKLKLANYWTPSVSKFISNDLRVRESKILLNLASDEYSAAIDANALVHGTQFIKVVFWEDGRTIAVHAKRARGLMVRYLSENNVNDLEGVQSFSEEGYAFLSEKSDDTTLVFNRQKGKQTKDKSSKPTKASQKKRKRK